MSDEYLIKRPDKPNEDDVVPCDCRLRATTDRPLAALWGSSRASTARNNSSSNLKHEISDNSKGTNAQVESSLESPASSGNDPKPSVPVAQKGKTGKEKSEQGREHVDCCTATCLCR